MEFKNKNVLVVGAARSGISAAVLLNKLGANVTLGDNKPENKIEGIIGLGDMGIKLYLGQNPDEEIVKNQSLIIQSPGVPLSISTFAIARKHKIPIMGEMELAFTQCPCPIAAITGTNGKTTTAALAGEIIKGVNKDTYVVGNIGIPFTQLVSDLNKDSFVIVEASSFQLETVSMFSPMISVVLNISPDHLDRHGTMENYFKAKTNIYKNANKGTYIILNYDDCALSKVKPDNEGKILWFSRQKQIEEGAFLKDNQLVLKLNGKEEKLINVNELLILGAHNVENALAASLIAACANVPAKAIAEGLKRFKGVPHRLEFVRKLNGVSYYNDSKGTNPEAALTALSAMKGNTVLIAGGYDKGGGFTELAKGIKGRVSHLIVIGETKRKIKDAAIKAGFNSIYEADSLEEAVGLASSLGAEGGNVLLSPACASWDMFKDYEERCRCFKELVNDLG